MELQADFACDLGTASETEQPLKELWITSAYTTLKGVRALQRLIITSNTKHAILGCNVQTEWKALEQLTKWGVNLQLMPDPPGGIFHPKCLYAEVGNGKAWVVSGSANLTEGGFGRNIEAVIRVAGPVTIPVIKKARRFFDDLSEAAAPLTPELLGQFKEVQEEIRRATGTAPSNSIGQMIGLDPRQALRLTAAGQRLVRNLDVERFHHYIRSTKMEASYKMVILPLLLQAHEGRLDIPDLARQFAGFYRLLSASGYPPERSPMVMRDVQDTELSRVISVLKGAPREALSRPGVVL